MGRIILFTGKGGVGKSSLASAHALKAAQSGIKTLLVSTDMAHNLSDIFNITFGEKEIELEKNLWGLEINPNYEMENNFSKIKDSILNMMKFSNAKDKETFEDIMVFPGLEELLSLLKILSIYQSNIYELIIIDCAPTGETLSLLKFPELAGWFMEKIFPIERIAAKVLRPITKTMFRIELPSEDAINDMEKLYLKLIKLQEIIRDRDITSVRIVAIPEKMVVEETKRNYMYLNLYDFNVDSIYINRIIPDEVENRFFDKWKMIQSGYIKELENVFAGMSIYKVKWYEIEVGGMQGLQKIVDDSLVGNDIFDIKRVKNREMYEKTEKGYKLKVYLPLGCKKDFDLHESNDDIIVKVKNFKRNIPKPNVLQKYEIAKAEFVDDSLVIFFEKGC